MLETMSFSFTLYQPVTTVRLLSHSGKIISINNITDLADNDCRKFFIMKNLFTMKNKNAALKITEINPFDRNAFAMKILMFQKLLISPFQYHLQTRHIWLCQNRRHQLVYNCVNLHISRFSSLTTIIVAVFVGIFPLASPWTKNFQGRKRNRNILKKSSSTTNNWKTENQL